MEKMMDTAVVAWKNARIARPAYCLSKREAEMYMAHYIYAYETEDYVSWDTVSEAIAA
jgi:hypothetical protein